MTPGEAVSRKQRGILDDTGHADVSVEESVQWHTITDPDTRPDDPDCRPRPFLWTRTPDWVIGAAAVVVFVLLLASPWLAS